MAETEEQHGVPVRELPSFVGIAESGDGTLSVSVDKILYGEPVSDNAAA
jgi:hypothetical protein